MAARFRARSVRTHLLAAGTEPSFSPSLDWPGGRGSNRRDLGGDRHPIVSIIESAPDPSRVAKPPFSGRSRPRSSQPVRPRTTASKLSNFFSRNVNDIPASLDIGSSSARRACQKNPGEPLIRSRERRLSGKGGTLPGNPPMASILHDAALAVVGLEASAGFGGSGFGLAAAAEAPSSS